MTYLGTRLIIPENNAANATPQRLFMLRVRTYSIKAE